jgi:pectinesterase
MKIKSTLRHLLLGTCLLITINNCVKEATKVIPVVIASDATEITSTTATVAAEVMSDGGAEVTVRGVCWNTSPDPTIADSKTEAGTGLGNYLSRLTGLAASQLYYVRAYATNSAGTSYSNQISFETIATP